ncbi:MAG TPA: FkbM family methyltransferase [Burkholderiales bacterium]|nr:FkbM family methyltransferase [Burkholderiales bacterium]
MITAGQMRIPDGDAYFQRVFARTGDRFQAELFQRALRYTPGRKIAIDIGAHVGSLTRQMAVHFASVIAFEPNPLNFACLQENATASTVAHFNVALGADEGYCDMAQHADNSGCWRVIPGGAVRIAPLDSFAFENVDLIKIDVEGFEGQVIRGAQQTIAACDPTIVFEDNGLGPKLYSSAWVDPRKLLAELGYRRRERFEKDEIWTR